MLRWTTTTTMPMTARTKPTVAGHLCPTSVKTKQNDSSVAPALGKTSPGQSLLLTTLHVFPAQQLPQMLFARGQVTQPGSKRCGWALFIPRQSLERSLCPYCHPNGETTRRSLACGSTAAFALLHTLYDTVIGVLHGARTMRRGLSQGRHFPNGSGQGHTQASHLHF